MDKDKLLVIAVGHIVQRYFGHQACGVDSYSRQQSINDSLDAYNEENDSDCISDLSEEVALAIQSIVMMKALDECENKKEVLRQWLVIEEGDEPLKSDNPLIQRALDMWVNL